MQDIGYEIHFGRSMRIVIEKDELGFKETLF